MRPSTPWIIVLIVSVLANGILIGFLLHRSADGPSWQPRHNDHRGGPPPGSGPRPGFDMRGFVRALPEDARGETFEAVRGTFGGMRPLMDEARAAREEVEALMVAEDFDAEAVAAALDRMHASHRAIERRIEGSVIEVLEDLDADTRRAAMEAGLDRPDFGRRGADARHGGEPHPDGPRH